MLLCMLLLWCRLLLVLLVLCRRRGRRHSLRTLRPACLPLSSHTRGCRPHASLWWGLASLCSLWNLGLGLRRSRRRCSLWGRFRSQVRCDRNRGPGITPPTPAPSSTATAPSLKRLGKRLLSRSLQRGCCRWGYYNCRCGWCLGGGGGRCRRRSFGRGLCRRLKVETLASKTPRRS